MEDKKENENITSNQSDQNLQFFYNQKNIFNKTNRIKIVRGKTFGEPAHRLMNSNKIYNQKSTTNLKNSEIISGTIDSQGRKQGKKRRISYIKVPTARSKAALRRYKTFHVNINGETDPDKIINKIANGSNISNLLINININQKTPQKNYYVYSKEILEESNEKDISIIDSK